MYQLYFHWARLFQVWPPPSILVVHVGSNDLWNIRTLDLLFMVKRDLHRFKITSPDTTIVFSEIFPCLSWLSSPQRIVMERMRKKG